jgi:hypothetical protein
MACQMFQNEKWLIQFTHMGINDRLGNRGVSNCLIKIVSGGKIETLSWEQIMRQSLIGTGLLPYTYINAEQIAF